MSTWNDLSNSGKVIEFYRSAVSPLPLSSKTKTIVLNYSLLLFVDRVQWRNRKDRSMWTCGLGMSTYQNPHVKLDNTSHQYV